MSRRSLSELIKAVGAPSLDPIPPDQYLWMQKAGEPPLYRLWSWMIYQTMHWGRDSAFAISADGHEFHLAHAAKDLEIAEKNIHLYWREGLRRGLWRNGTRAEGTQRMYLCGRVQPLEEGKEAGKQSLAEEHEIICTYDLTPYIYQKLKEWPSDKYEKFLAERLVEVKVRKDSVAETVAAVRTILNDSDDTWFSQRGLEKRRNKAEEAAAGEDPDLDEQARVERRKALLPYVENFVQKIRVSVQSAPPPVYKDNQKSSTNTPTLLGSEKSQIKPEERAGVNLDGSHRPSGPSHSGDGKKLNQLPALSLTPAEKQAEKLIFSRFADMQEAFPNTDFSSELISASKRQDQLLVHRVLYAVGAANIEDFLALCWRRFKGQDKQALGKLPAKSRAPGAEHGPRSFGLLLSWAQAYGEKLVEAARASAEEQARFRGQEISALRELLADPSEPEVHKQEYREQLRAYGVEASAKGGGR